MDRLLNRQVRSPGSRELSGCERCNSLQEAFYHFVEWHYIGLKTYNFGSTRNVHLRQNALERVAASPEVGTGLRKWLAFDCVIALALLDSPDQFAIGGIQPNHEVQSKAPGSNRPIKPIEKRVASDKLGPKFLDHCQHEYRAMIQEREASVRDSWPLHCSLPGFDVEQPPKFFDGKRATPRAVT